MKRFACFIIALFATIWALRAQQTLVTYTPDGVKTYDTAEPPSELLDTTQFVVSYRMLYRQRPENEHPMEDLLLLQIGRNVRNSTPTRRGRPTRSCASRRPSR